MQRFLVLLLSFPHLLFSVPQAYFHPPEGWQIADPKTYAPSVRIAFLLPRKGGFTPSLNLAEEEGVMDLDDYAEAVRKIHSSDPKNRWRKLGSLQTRSGKALLTEIETQSNTRPIRLLQLLFLHEQSAYILTAAAPREEMGSLGKTFLNAFKSFTITENLLESIPEKERREALYQTLLEFKEKSKESRFQEEVWNPFQKRFLSEFNDMGAYWQLLLLKYFQEELKKKV